MEPLAGLFGGDPAATVALTPLGSATLEDLSRRAATVASLARGGGRWALACADPLAFTAGLLGLALAGATVLLPPNLLPGTLAQFSGCDGVLRDGDVVPGPEGTRAPIPDTALEFWTSGSTGAPKRVPRRLAEVVAEVPILEGLAAGRAPGGLVLGTVPHHHFYGLLFRILWPLGTGRPFATEVCGDPDRYAAVLRGGQAQVLVSSPAHLSRLPDLVDLDGFRHHPELLFSSGGPLRREDALRWRRWVPEGVLEIYGSTESGGVAWRNPGPDPASEAWTPFADTQVGSDPDGALRVRSPRLAEGELRLEDGAELLGGGRFRLRGRLDRVIKLEGKRISLVALEAALEAHPGVARAAVTPLEGPRATLGAVLVLTEEGEAQPREALRQALRSHLARTFDPLALPRRWRFLGALPQDDRGKVRAQDLQALFRTRAESLP